MELVSKVWGNLCNYMKYWLILHENNTRCSNYKLEEEINLNTYLSYEKHEVSTCKIWDSNYNRVLSILEDEYTYISLVGCYGNY